MIFKQILRSYVITMQIKSLSMLVLLLMILMLSLLSGFLIVKQLMKVPELKIQCGLEQTINEPTPFKIKARSITI